MRLEQITDRIARVRLPQKALADRAALDEDTVSRALTNKTDPRNSTLEKIERALTAEEIDLRDHLLALHPVERSAA